MKGKIYLRQQLLKRRFIAERYGKRLLVQLKNELMYKILRFVEDEDSPFQEIEPYRKLNTQWGIVYSRVYKEGNTGDVL